MTLRSFKQSLVGTVSFKTERKGNRRGLRLLVIDICWDCFLAAMPWPTRMPKFGYVIEITCVSSSTTKLETFQFLTQNETTCITNVQLHQQKKSALIPHSKQCIRIPPPATPIQHVQHAEMCSHDRFCSRRIERAFDRKNRLQIFCALHAHAHARSRHATRAHSNSYIYVD